MKMNASKREYGYSIRACMQGLRIDSRDMHQFRDMKLKEEFQRGQDRSFCNLVQSETYDEAMNAAGDDQRKIQVGPLSIEERKGYWAIQF